MTSGGGSPEKPEFTELNEAKARINKFFREFMTEEVAAAWWNEPKPQLGNRSANDVWEEDPQTVIDFVFGGTRPT